MTGPARAAGLAALLALAAALPAAAHPASVAYADIVIAEREVEVRLSANLFELDLLLGLDADLDARVDGPELDARREAVAGYLRGAVTVSAGGRPLPAELVELGLARGADGQPLLEGRLRFAAGRPLGQVAIRCRLLAELGADHTTLARIAAGGRTEPFVFRGDAVYAGLGSGLTGVLEFFRLGVAHIFAGWDHLAFLVGLLLAGGRLLAVLAIVSAFTAAHTVTLSLAALQVVAVPGRVVEATIAASIVWVAAENLTARQVARRWLVGGLFGLVHGFGFATTLRELGLPTRGLVGSLLAFNLGVEAGQVAIVLLVVPALALLRRRPWHRGATRAASVVILALGLYWLYERLV